MPHNTPALPWPSSLTVKQASAHLAEVAAIGRRLREKTAATGLAESFQPYLDQAKNYGNQALTGINSAVKNISDPQTGGWEAARNGLIGAGIGAGAGGLASLSQPKGRRRSLSTMLQGALLGAGIGGGGTLAMQQAGLVNATPDSGVHKRIDELSRTLDRNVARKVPEQNAAVQEELAKLQERAKTIPAPQSATPPPLGPQLRSSARDAWNGDLLTAGTTLFPNPVAAGIESTVGGTAGYVVGSAADRYANATANRAGEVASRMERLKTLDPHDIVKTVGDTARSPAHAKLIARSIQEAPVGKPVNLNRGAARALLAKTPYTPKPVGTGYRRAGGIGGAILTPILRQQFFPGVVEE